jgi:hypothetical protein
MSCFFSPSTKKEIHEQKLNLENPPFQISYQTPQRPDERKVKKIKQFPTGIIQYHKKNITPSNLPKKSRNFVSLHKKSQQKFTLNQKFI